MSAARRLRLLGRPKNDTLRDVLLAYYVMVKNTDVILSSHQMFIAHSSNYKSLKPKLFSKKQKRNVWTFAVLKKINLAHLTKLK